MNFDIDIYRSVGPLTFGMGQHEVTAVLGVIDQTVLADDAIVELYCTRFDLLAQVRSDTDQLCEVGFGHRATNVSLGAIYFFEQSAQQVIAELCKLDSTAKTGFGSIVFPLLGISLTGFLKGGDDARTMTAFAKGHWDSMLPEMKSFVLSKSKSMR